jgi:hypothetical protein
MRRAVPIALAVIGALALATTPAAAQQASRKKAIWGPVSSDSFRTYHRLGVGIYEMTLDWRQAAPTRPADPTDPDDPAYKWPADVSKAIHEADRYGIRVLLMMIGTPQWANGGRAPNWVPTRPADLADFATAAASRYRRVRHWMVWGEPTRQPNFMPLDSETPGELLTAREKRAPRRYARMLDASYHALKRVRPSNLVIGGNSYTTGDISPLNWIREMRLPNGKRPRMDMYGHNPFTLRRPDLSQSLFRPPTGYADFSDLDAVWGWLDRYGYRDSRGRRLRIFLSEWTLPTDHPNHEFNFYVTHAFQASCLREALRIVRGNRRLYSLGWIGLYDDPPRPSGDEVNRGLLDYRGVRKPSFYAYRDG